MPSSPRARHALVALAFGLLAVAWSPPAHAAPWFDGRDGEREDRYADGDIDAEDLLAPRVPRGASGSGAHFAPSWFSIGAFAGVRDGTAREYGGVVILGIPLERTAAP